MPDFKPEIIKKLERLDLSPGRELEIVKSSRNICRTFMTGKSVMAQPSRKRFRQRSLNYGNPTC